MHGGAPFEDESFAGPLESVRQCVLSPLFIGFITALCLVVRALRTQAQVDPRYPFVGWNLLLAWIPLVLAYGISWSARSKLAWPLLLPFAAFWIVFLPNAPYLVTDLVHLRDGVNAPNVILLALLAVTGLLIGVKAVQLVQGAIERRFGTAAGWRAVQAIALLTACGVYLGRVVRWNSWTAILHPHVLVHAVVRSPSDPGRLLLALLATAVFAIGFYSAYWLLARPRQIPLVRPVRGGTAP
jgi:uncharacterized membrane protein